MKEITLTCGLLFAIAIAFTQTNQNLVRYGHGFRDGTPCPGMPTVTDIDGNVYNTVVIGEQCWMAENLKSTRYRNGTNIDFPGANDNAWANNNSGAYAWYNNSIAWKDIYGALYNWHAAANTNGLCPENWRVPSTEDWLSLISQIGGAGSPNGNKLKSCRQVNSIFGDDCSTNAHPRWNEHPTHAGTNDFGFSAYGGGNRTFMGNYGGMGMHGDFWTSTEQSASTAWGRYVDYDAGWIGGYNYPKRQGIAVRCVTEAGSTEILPGDANCDGIVNVLDVVTCINHILGLNPDPFCFENADANANGEVDVLDVVLIINIILETGAQK
jgi:uncharacterized protein (TIGR02145 family)